MCRDTCKSRKIQLLPNCYRLSSILYLRTSILYLRTSILYLPIFYLLSSILYLHFTAQLIVAADAGRYSTRCPAIADAATV